MIPPRGKSTGQPRKNKFYELGVEEYYLLSKKEKLRVASAAYTYGKKSGKIFKMRTVDGEVRLYRKS